MFRHILVPLDGSRLGTRALHYAIDIAQRYGAKITLVRAVTPTTIVPPTGTAFGVTSPTAAEMTFEEAERLDNLNVSRARRYMNTKLREVKARGIEGNYKVLLGDAAEAIMKQCKREKADLIVMTTHGRSGIKRAILGSVADKVIRESGDPVLVIRPIRRRHK